MDGLNGSPRWSSTTKLIVSLAFLVIAAGLLIKFQRLIPPLMMMILMAYLINPVADLASRKLHIGWKISVSLIYFLLLVLLLGLLTLGGVGLVGQVEGLIGGIQNYIQNLPALLGDLSTKKFYLGPMLLDFSKLDMVSLGQQVLGTIEPVLSQTGGMLGSFASGAANFFGWTFFVLLVSYFILMESDGLWRGILQFNIPGYQPDLEKMGIHLSRIWNSFLRGQLLVMALSMIIYSIVLNLLGVSYAFGLAIMAGFARFIPYAGSFVVWTTLALVSYFQTYKLFGLRSWVYVVLVVFIAWLIDFITDNIIMPRIMASALKVHPAAVLVAAIISLDLLGILGVIIAAPMLASLMLVWRYFSRKLFDLDPWGGLDEIPRTVPISQQLMDWITPLLAKLKKKSVMEK